MENNEKMSSADFMNKLVMAKKIMNKVETGNFEKKTNQTYNDYDNDDLNENFNFLPEIPQVPQVLQSQNFESSVINEEKIKNSKLPDEIKKLMINNPIVQPNNQTISPKMKDVFDGAKKIMEREGLTKTKKQLNESTNNVTDYNKLANLIENIVRKVLDEKIQELNTNKGISINENLAIKVGDSIFSGKITKV